MWVTKIERPERIDKKITGPSRGSNTGPRAGVLRVAALSANHTTRPPGLLFISADLGFALYP